MTEPTARTARSEAPVSTQDSEQPGEGTNTPDASDAPETFTRAYVEELRNEAKANRQKAQRADFLATEVRRLATREACRGVLTDPEALGWSEDFEGEDGLPDHDKITAAAEALAAERPWLARVRGDVGQGQHGSGTEALSLSALLRA